MEFIGEILTREEEYSMNELREIAYIQAQLIWSRYNAMIVAHSILIGFLAASPPGSNAIAILGCIIGLLLALIWWRMTSVGWSFMHALLKRTPQDDTATPEKIYDEWTKKFWFPRCQDSIWWGAHAVIAIFFAGYLVLFYHFARNEQLPGNFIIVVIVVFGLWFVGLLVSSLKTHNIRE